MKIFGRGGLELMGMLKEGKHGFDEASEGLDKMGGKLSQIDVEKIEQAHKVLAELGQAWDSFLNHIVIDASTLAPAFGPALAAIEKYWNTLLAIANAPITIFQWLTGGHASKMDELAEKTKGLALAQQKEAEAQKVSNEASKEAAHLTQSLMTPMEKLNQEYSRGLELFGMGKLGGGALHRIQDKMTAQSDIERDKANEPFKEMQESADSIADSFKTPLQRARDDFNALWEAAEQGADVSEEAISAAFHKIGDESDAMNAKLNKPFEEFEKGLHDAADRMHEELETPLEKMNEKISKIQNNPFLSDVDKKRGIDKATKEYQDQISKVPEHQALKGLTADSAEFQQRLAERMRGDGVNDAAKQTAQATVTIAAAMPQLLKNTDPSSDIDPAVISVSGGSMDGLPSA